jgi:hypothetical protein
MSKLIIPPDTANYSTKTSEGEVISVQLDGGASRFRRAQIGFIHNVTVSWTVSLLAYNYLEAFFRLSTRMGSLPFTIDLILEGGALTTHTARFKPGTFGLSEQSGQTFTVVAELEVTPLAVNDTNDLNTILAYDPTYT